MMILFSVVTVGLEPTVTIRNGCPAALTLAGNLCSLELLPPSSATGGGGIRSPIDVNDVLSVLVFLQRKHKILWFKAIKTDQIPQESIGFFGGANCYQQ